MLAVGICLITLLALAALGFPLRSALLRWHIPPAVSLMTLGAIVGPNVLDLLPTDWLSRATVLSKSAFVILLLRAGLSLQGRTLRSIAVPALLFGALPVAAEAGVLIGLTRATLFSDWNLCILAGVLIAAVSPAVILPTMLAQKDLGRGSERLVPDRIMGQTIVNAFIAQTAILMLVDIVAPIESDPTSRLLCLPLAVLGGIAVGGIAGLVLRVDPILAPRTTGRVRVATSIAVVAAIAVYFGCGELGLETVFATLALGVILRRRLETHEPLLRAELRRFWSVAEIVLFANLGAQIQLSRLLEGGTIALLLGTMATALAARLVVAHLMARATPLTDSERRYATVAHIPKATVQAVYGAYPLFVFKKHEMSAEIVAAGDTLLVMAALAIVATAPLGAILLDRLGARWLPTR